MERRNGSDRRTRERRDEEDIFVPQNRRYSIDDRRKKDRRIYEGRDYGSFEYSGKVGTNHIDR